MSNRLFFSSNLLAVVVKGDDVSSAVSELGAVHLTMEGDVAEAEVSLFFPDITDDLMGQGGPEEPQTQMQLQSKDGDDDK